MKKLLLSTILLAISNYLICQVTFEKTYEIEDAYNGICVEQSPDNGFVILTGDGGVLQIFNSLFKTDEYGNIDWNTQHLP